VIKVADQAEAIRLANDSEYGLSATVWTSKPSEGRADRRQLDAGAVNINDALMNVLARRCCVSDIGACEDWADGGWPWLEAGGEFVEGGANPIMQGQLGRKLVVAASQVLYEGVPG
jgi:Aldehyde dehydrogenase family